MSLFIGRLNQYGSFHEFLMKQKSIGKRGTFGTLVVIINNKASDLSEAVLGVVVRAVGRYGLYEVKTMDGSDVFAEGNNLYDLEVFIKSLSQSLDLMFFRYEQLWNRVGDYENALDQRLKDQDAREADLNKEDLRLARLSAELSLREQEIEEKKEEMMRRFLPATSFPAGT